MEGNGESSASAAGLHAHAPRKPPAVKGSGGFVRHRLSSQSSGSDPATPQYSVPYLQGQLLHALSGLGGLAAKLILVLAQPELKCEELYRIGFATISTCSQFAQSFNEADCTPDVSGIVILNVGTELRAVLECLKVLDRFANAPPSIAVMLLHGQGPFETAEQELQLARTLLESGADDILTLYREQVLARHRLQEAIVRTEIMARKASILVGRELEVIKKKMSKSLQCAWAKFMWDFPGKVLQNIPFLDLSMQERDQGVGDYDFSNLLGSGSFGAVFKAEHPDHGTCAMKIISKNSIKNVYQLFSIDMELCIMASLSAHPNLVWGHGALHTQENIILVMNYCGALNLHNFITNRLSNTNEATLPMELAERFCKQAATGLAHLHGSWVCHRDLKPVNFIVADGGNILQLADFGLAVIALGERKLLHSCGSLPFAAPEVLRIQTVPRAAALAYNGFAADIWSLGVNFVELVFGLYSMDRLLGWVPRPPSDCHQRLHDIEHFEDVWRHVPEISIAGMHRVVDNMFRLRPAERWSIGRIVGSDGLGIDLLTGSAMPSRPNSAKPLPTFLL